MMNPEKEQLYRSMIQRSEMVLGPDVMRAIAGKKVIIFGVGGVGSWCAEGLIRSGFMNLTVVDSDRVCATNINRQLQATSLNVGKPKVFEIAERLRSINPLADITAIDSVYDSSTSASFSLPSRDYVIDAIDSISNKVHLIETCLNSGVKIFSSMGAAAKTDPSRIKPALLTDTKNCPLARIVRKELRHRRLTTDVMCVYSDELPVEPRTIPPEDTESSNHTGGESQWDARKKRINGALVHITAIFGFHLTSLVINDIVKNMTCHSCEGRNPMK